MNISDVLKEAKSTIVVGLINKWLAMKYSDTILHNLLMDTIREGSGIANTTPEQRSHLFAETAKLSQQMAETMSEQLGLKEFFKDLIQ